MGFCSSHPVSDAVLDILNDTLLPKSQVSAVDMESYVVVDHRDVLDAIGAFVAAYLATLPEAQHMQPKQLQEALKQTFQAREACHVLHDVLPAL